MTVRNSSFHVASAVSIGLTITASIVSGSAFGKPRPNFVIIIADDLGYGDLSCFGSTAIKTPNLDRMAAEGMMLTDFHSNGMVSTPTRAALMTGRYQQRAGLEGVILQDIPEHQTAGLQKNEITFANVLSDNGYDTALYGKWHLGSLPQYHPYNFGFKHYKGYIDGNVDYYSHINSHGELNWWNGDKIEDDEGYTTTLINNYAVDYIHKAGEQPFCLVVTHECPHGPLQAPGDPVIRTEVAKRPYGTSTVGRDKADTYKGMVEEMDRGIGEILSAIRERGLEENTLIVFLSDNGPAHGNGGSAGELRGGKSDPFEGGHRVSCIAKMKGIIESGSVCEYTAIGMDLFPTMLDMANIEYDDFAKPLDGVSIYPLLLGKEIAPRSLFWMMGPKKAMREGNWKYVYEAKKLKNGAITEQTYLFNLSKDISEHNNLAEEYPQRVEQMKAALASWQTEVRGEVPEQLAQYIKSLSFEF
jgi:arylsulfatase A-like enzyme